MTGERNRGMSGNIDVAAARPVIGERGWRRQHFGHMCARVYVVTFAHIQFSIYRTAYYSIRLIAAHKQHSAEFMQTISKHEEKNTRSVAQTFDFN